MALSSTSKIKSRGTGSAFDAGCPTDASIWRLAAAGVSGLSAIDACMKDKGVISEPREACSLSRGSSKYDSGLWLVVFR
jgi:hypothetical protein